MSRSKFSEGTLVRKYTESGTPIGPWLKVKMANSYKIYVEPVEPLARPNLLEQVLDRKHVYKPNIVRVSVSDNCIKRIKSGDKVVSHPASILWNKIYMTKPDLVEFYTMDGLKKLFCTIDTVKTANVCRENTIIVFIDRVIC